MKGTISKIIVILAFIKPSCVRCEFLTNMFIYGQLAWMARCLLADFFGLFNSPSVVSVFHIICFISNCRPSSFGGSSSLTLAFRFRNFCFYFVMAIPFFILENWFEYSHAIILTARWPKAYPMSPNKLSCRSQSRHFTIKCFRREKNELVFLSTKSYPTYFPSRPLFSIFK